MSDKKVNEKEKESNNFTPKKEFTKKVGNYIISEQIGIGTFSKVTKAFHTLTGETVAVKILDKSKIKDNIDIERISREIEILKSISHPNIAQLYESNSTIHNFYLIMEYIEGGDLCDYISKNLCLDEKTSCHFFRQLISVIEYLFDMGITHRDIKPENILLDASQKNIKVIDFGMSKVIDPNDIMFERVGTAYYIAPEVLEGMYDEKCDIWSAGVILYILLCGYPCFNGETDEKIYKQIKKKKYSFPSPEWDVISDDAKNLIKKMLSDAMERISAEEILKDPWVLNHAPNAKKGGEVQLNEGQLRSYAKSSKMRKAVLTYIASRLTQSEIDELNKNFQEIDDNNDGKLTLEEIKKAASKNKAINLEQIEEIFKSIDTDGSGSIEYTEFISATLDKALYLQKEKLREAFSLFDVDHSGKISNVEIAKVLGMDKRSKEIHKIIEKYDSNKDGEIDFEEFFEMMKDLS